jgi:hypothetical protein
MKTHIGLLTLTFTFLIQITQGMESKQINTDIQKNTDDIKIEFQKSIMGVVEIMEKLFPNELCLSENLKDTESQKARNTCENHILELTEIFRFQLRGIATINPILKVCNEKNQEFRDLQQSFQDLQRNIEDQNMPGKLNQTVYKRMDAYFKSATEARREYLLNHIQNQEFRDLQGIFQDLQRNIEDQNMLGKMNQTVCKRMDAYSKFAFEARREYILNHIVNTSKLVDRYYTDYMKIVEKEDLAKKKQLAEEEDLAKQKENANTEPENTENTENTVAKIVNLQEEKKE